MAVAFDRVCPETLNPEPWEGGKGQESEKVLNTVLSIQPREAGFCKKLDKGGLDRLGALFVILQDKG